MIRADCGARSCNAGRLADCFRRSRLPFCGALIVCSLQLLTCAHDRKAPALLHVSSICIRLLTVLWPATATFRILTAQSISGQFDHVQANIAASMSPQSPSTLAQSDARLLFSLATSALLSDADLSTQSAASGERHSCCCAQLMRWRAIATVSAQKWVLAVDYQAASVSIIATAQSVSCPCTLIPLAFTAAMCAGGAQRCTTARSVADSDAVVRKRLLPVSPSRSRV